MRPKVVLNPVRHNPRSQPSRKHSLNQNNDALDIRTAGVVHGANQRKQRSAGKGHKQLGEWRGIGWDPTHKLWDERRLHTGTMQRHTISMRAAMVMLMFVVGIVVVAVAKVISV